MTVSPGPFRPGLEFIAFPRRLPEWTRGEWQWDAIPRKSKPLLVVMVSWKRVWGLRMRIPCFLLLVYWDKEATGVGHLARKHFLQIIIHKHFPSGNCRQSTGSLWTPPLHTQSVELALLLAVYYFLPEPQGIYSYRIPHLQESMANAVPNAGLIAEVRQDFNSNELLYHLIIFTDM